MKYIYLLIPFLWAQTLLAQTKLPIIKATTKAVAIKDGAYLYKDAWTISPNVKLDVYTADRTRETKWVTFYTDIDSIKVKVKPGTKHNFIVVLNGKDSCYTQITSAIRPEIKIASNKVTHDTIPFTLTSFNAIHVQSIVNSTDTLNLHFDVGSFDFRFTKDAILKKTKLLSNQPDALAGKVVPNYNNLNKVHTVQMGSLIFTNPEIVPTGVTAREMDGRFGWNLFEGKQVEIDYDHNVLIVHSKLPKKLKGYTKSKLDFIQSFVCMTGTFDIENKKYEGKFLVDTGSDQAIILDSTWMAKQNFPKNLKLIKTSVLSDPRGVKYETKIVEAPAFQMENLMLTNIPTYLLGSNNPTRFEINFLGNDLLKRFNIIIDFKEDYIYLKPNKLMGMKYRENS
ncbi:hypothetical protein [Flavobacterium sp. '19STA2R22 D10 B1']|uniref:hypothetical protein n=1 Tax=Flavobacterium aerium TaxID=3037261 RepID=UPI00278BE8BA|nr:hypothetical protein [Flavobacterium sp. '19STA2R22 D10 B1']